MKADEQEEQEEEPDLLLDVPLLTKQTSDISSVDRSLSFDIPIVTSETTHGNSDLDSVRSPSDAETSSRCSEREYLTPSFKRYTSYGARSVASATSNEYYYPSVVYSLPSPSTSQSFRYNRTANYSPRRSTHSQGRSSIPRWKSYHHY
jgi:hypothetical protein